MRFKNKLPTKLSKLLQCPYFFYSLIMQKEKPIGCRTPKNKTTIQLGDQTILAKTKDFFKPEESVWNNPYRSSTRLYKYYHAANDIYQRYEGASRKRLEQNDKENAEKNRINKLIHFRNRARQTFKQRQESRKILELYSKGEISSKVELATENDCFERSYKNNTQSAQVYSLFNTIKNIEKPRMKKNQTEATIDLELKSSNSKAELSRNFRSKIVKSTQNLRRRYKD